MRRRRHQPYQQVVDGWVLDDELRISKRDTKAGSAPLESVHRRSAEFSEIRLHHLWTEMARTNGSLSEGDCWRNARSLIWFFYRRFYGCYEISS